MNWHLKIKYPILKRRYSMSRFYCPRCEMSFEQTDKNKIAECPICKNKRNDGLNQINLEKFQCIICGCVFSNSLNTNPVCPDAYNHLGGNNGNN